jgi:hypothetical protein
MTYKFYPEKFLISNLDKNKYEKLGFKYEAEEELIPGYRYKAEQGVGCTGFNLCALYKPDENGYVTIPDRIRTIFKHIEPAYVEVKDIEDLTKIIKLFGPVDMDEGVVYLVEDY